MSISRDHFLAWGVHLYTMLGGVIGMMALVAISDNQIQIAWILLLVTLLIDMTDGTFARRFRVSEVVPKFDGSKVDDIVDFLTYVWAPVLIIHVTGLISNPLWLGLPVLGSLYVYGRPGMKEIEGEAYFVAFPSYWNVLALYLYWLRPEESLVIVTLIFFFVLCLIPTRYLYPSKNPKYPILTLGMGAIWLILIIYLILQPYADPTLVNISMIYPIYYMVASFFIEWKYRNQ